MVVEEHTHFLKPRSGILKNKKNENTSMEITEKITQNNYFTSTAKV